MLTTFPYTCWPFEKRLCKLSVHFKAELFDVLFSLNSLCFLLTNPLSMILFEIIFLYSVRWLFGDCLLFLCRSFSLMLSHLSFYFGFLCFWVLIPPNPFISNVLQHWRVFCQQFQSFSSYIWVLSSFRIDLHKRWNKLSCFLLYGDTQSSMNHLLKRLSILCFFNTLAKNW